MSRRIFKSDGEWLTEACDLQRELHTTFRIFLSHHRNIDFVDLSYLLTESLAEALLERRLDIKNNK